ncbi:MAG: dihydroneopterin aldolase [Muribaculaceae bacterium]|nr:dihydroneopterin aldolase [Muribaculaceae bacterium]
MPRGCIEINKLKVYAYHGVLDQEHRVGNNFLVSVKLYYPILNAMKNDNLSGTLNYAEVIETIQNIMKTPSHLIENVIERIRASLALQYPLIEGGTITIEKLSPPIPNTQIESVAVTYKW